MKKSFNVKIEEMMLLKIAYIAKYECMSNADLAISIFHSYIKDFERRNGRIEEAELKQISMFEDYTL